METIKAEDYSSRDELDTYVTTTYGKSIDKKDALIKGTTQELKKLKLYHSATVWGVPVEATDHIPKHLTPRPQRGKIYKSKLNGQHAQINKSSSRKRRT